MNNLFNILSCPCVAQPIVIMVKMIYNFVYILVPVGLIVMGMMDFMKAMMSKDENDMKKAQTLFVKRIVMGVMVFLVFTVVNFAVNLVSKYSEEDGNKIDWLSCWNEPGEMKDGTCTNLVPDENGNNNNSDWDNRTQTSPQNEDQVING